MSHRNKHRMIQQRPAMPMSDSGRQWMGGGILIDVVMPVYGEWVLAERSYASIEAAMEGLGQPYRVIVVDNGTPDWQDPQGHKVSPIQQALGLREKMRPQDTFIRLEENKGYPGALNAGAAKGRAPLILVWTSDVAMAPGTIAPMVRDMDEPDIGVVGVKLLFPLDESPHGPSGKIQHAGVEFNIKGEPIHIFIGWSPDNPRVNKRVDVPAVTGALFLTRRSLWEKCGGMDLAFGKGTYEDMDYCFKVREGGARVLYEPAAWGYHYVGGSIRKGAGGQGFNLGMNALLFRGRWAPRIAWSEWKRW